MVPANLASVRVRFADPDTQFKAKLVLEKDLNPDSTDPAFIVTVNLQANTPMWMQKLHALPMFLGLDLRGGVHFLMQVDAKAVLNKKVQGVQSASRSVLRDKNIRHAGIERVGDSVQINFRDAETRLKAKNVPVRPDDGTGVRRCGRRQRFETEHHPEAGRPESDHRRRRETEYLHPVQARQRAGRGRAADPAARS